MLIYREKRKLSQYKKILKKYKYKLWYENYKFLSFLNSFLKSVRAPDRTKNALKVDGTSFSDAGSLVTTAHLTREICPRDLKYRKSKTNMVAQKLLLSEIGSKQKLSFGRQLLSNSICVRRTLFEAQCPKFKARVSISVAINLVGDRDQ